MESVSVSNGLVLLRGPCCLLYVAVTERKISWPHEMVHRTLAVWAGLHAAVCSERQARDDIVPVLVVPPEVEPEIEQ